MKKVVLATSLLTSMMFVNCSKFGSSGQGSVDLVKAKQIEKDLDALIPKYLSDNKDAPVNNILIYLENENKKIVYHKAFGFRDEEKTDPAQKQDLFKTASSSKPFTAAVVLQMYEEGKFDLNDPISKYIGDNTFVNFDKLHLFNNKSYGKIITIAQALNHTSGVADIFLEDQQFIGGVLSNPSQQWTPKTLFEKFYELNYNTKSKFVPGANDKFAYSDTNYFLLGLLIEKISGNTYESEVRKRVLVPLQMNDTYFEYRELKVSPNKFVETFFRNNNVTRNINTSFDWAGGGYVITTLDLKKFIIGLMTNKLFKNPTTLQKMITDYGGSGLQTTSGAGYGYGIMNYKKGGATFFGHGGFWGVRFLYSPEKKITICLSVGQSENVEKADELLDEAIKKVDY